MEAQRALKFALVVLFALMAGVARSADDDTGFPGNGTWLNLPSKSCFWGSTFWRWEHFGGGPNYDVVVEYSDPSLYNLIENGRPYYYDPEFAFTRFEGNNITLEGRGQDQDRQVTGNPKGSIGGGSYYFRMQVTASDRNFIYSPWIPFANGTCDEGFPSNSSTSPTSTSTSNSSTAHHTTTSASIRLSSTATSTTAPTASSNSTSNSTSSGSSGPSGTSLPASGGQSRHLGGGAVAGIVIGVLVALVVLAALALVCIRRFRRQQLQYRAPMSSSANMVTAFTHTDPAPFRSDVKVNAVAGEPFSGHDGADDGDYEYGAGIEYEPAHTPELSPSEYPAPQPTGFDYNAIAAPMDPSTPPVPPNGPKPLREASPPPEPSRASRQRQTHEVDAGRLQRVRPRPPPGYN